MLRNVKEGRKINIKQIYSNWGFVYSNWRRNLARINLMRLRIKSRWAESPSQATS